MDERLRFMTDLLAPLWVAPGNEVSLSCDHDLGYPGGVARRSQCYSHGQAAGEPGAGEPGEGSGCDQDAFKCQGRDRCLAHQGRGIGHRQALGRADRCTGAAARAAAAAGRPGWPRWRAARWPCPNRAGWSGRNSVTRVPASHRPRTARRSSSTSPPHTPCAPTPNAAAKGTALEAYIVVSLLSGVRTRRRGRCSGSCRGLGRQAVTAGQRGRVRSRPGGGVRVAG